MRSVYTRVKKVVGGSFQLRNSRLENRSESTGDRSKSRVFNRLRGRFIHTLTPVHPYPYTYICTHINIHKHRQSYRYRYRYRCMEGRLSASTSPSDGPVR